MKYGKLVRKFDQANREIDLKGVDNKIRGGMRMFSTVAFLNAGNLNDRSEFIAAANLAAVVTLHMQDGKWRQAASHGAFALLGRAVIGGNANPFKDDGIGGVWTSCVDGESYLREDLPEGKAHPEGIFKDVGATHGPHGLGSPLRKHRAGNVELANQLTRMFDLFDEYKAAGVLLEESKLVPPRFWVMPDDGHIDPRWRNTDDPEYEAALAMVDEIVARRTRDAAWAIPGLTQGSVTADCSAKVADVKGGLVVLEHSGGSVERSAPVEEVRSVIHRMTGYDTADLNLVPVVGRGQVVGPNTPLFGPVKPDLNSSVLRLRQCVAGTDGDASHLASRQLTLMRLYALVAEGRQLPTGHVVYPIELAAPKSTRHLFAQVAGVGWDARIQRIQVRRHPEPVLIAQGIGCTVDLFNTSQRKRSDQLLAKLRKKRAVEAAKRAAEEAESADEPSDAEATE